MWCALALFLMLHLFLHFAAQFSSFLISHLSFLVSRLSTADSLSLSPSLILSVCLFDAFNKFQQMSVDGQGM